MLLEKSGTNVGSICKMRIMDCREADPLPFEFNGSLIGEVTPTDKWQQIYFTRDSAHFAERPSGQNNEMALKFRVPKDAPATLATILMLESKQWIVEITDLNGFTKVAGREDEGCSIRRELRDHGQNRRDSNHYNMVISLTRIASVAFTS